jgi:5-formyltetrahydrofolate cyclo-ligase
LTTRRGAPPADSLQTAKAALRPLQIALRRGLDEQHRTACAAKLAAIGFEFLQLARPSIIAGYAAIEPELDPGPLMERLFAAGHALALPVMVGRDRPLEFRAYVPGDTLATTTWGIREPLATATVVAPDVVLTALLAFDAEGWRLGYGGGYFDRSLAALRAEKPVIAVGIAYDEQRVDAVPHSVYDQRLDWVLTPSGPLRTAGA